ncbi:hypothetical protein L596_018993 [Steinernema carpocapsae]|nr:hypothetical protein L596_018993 [Steinernema carpocapsae]
MHLALEHKDSDIETWMNKCHQLEKADADSNGRWQAKVNSLTAAIAALETEKSDMVEKLSQAKQEGAVREEEMKRRQKLEENFKKTREADAAAANEKMESEIRRVEDEWRLKLKELEEQMQLAIEEREMVKVAALAQQDRKNDEMEVINTQLNEEKIKLQAQLEEIHEKNRRQMQELSSSIETNSTRHKEEISQLNESHQEIVGNMKLAIDSKQAEIDKLLVELESKGAEKIPDGQLEEVSQLVEKLRVKENEVEDLTKKIEDLEKSISAARASFEEDLESEKADGDKRVEEFKSKAEKKIGKMKRQCETDIQAAKAELLLELDEKRSELATKQEEIHQFNLSIALFDTQANELKQLRLDYDKLQASVKEHASLQEQFTVLEKQLSETLDQLREKNEQLKSGVAERNGLHADLVALKQIIDDCETEKQAEIKKAQVKADLDRQRMVRDLQREIKKLYQDLNEKTAALDDANSRLRDLENNSLEKVETVPLNQAQRVSSIEDGPMVEAVDQEELQNLRDRLCQYQKEMAELREKLSREVVKHGNDGRKSPYSAAVATTVATMDMHNMNRQSTATSLPNHCDPSNLSFAEPTEAEYLRNVLYRYMSERETLGKESVTLAKVIGTVAKFSREQLDAVVLKEQARSQGWGGTVQALGQSVLSHASNGHGLS